VCDPGSAQNQTSQSSCEQCPAGTYPDPSSVTCLKCSKGTYSNAGESECKVCDPGSTQNQMGQSSCKQCPAGTYPDPSRVTCLQCSKGMYSNAGESECKVCDLGSAQNQTGQPSCKYCPPNTYPDPSSVSCLQCPYRLGSEANSDICPFCADNFYLNVRNVNAELLNKDPTSFCLPCPANSQCEKNTTVETLKGNPGFWRDSLRTTVFYKCNNIARVCLGGRNSFSRSLSGRVHNIGDPSCDKGHSGVKCEVCVEKERYFDQSKGECSTCPSFSRLASVAGIVAGSFILLFIMKYIAYRYTETERFIANFLLSLTTIGLQAKFKIVISFCQVVVTLQPVYGVRMHSAFTSWFKVFSIFNFGLAETFGIPDSCFGSMKMRLLIGAGWPYALVLVLVIGIFIYMIAIDMQRFERKDAILKFLSRSLHGVIVIFYFVLPSVCRQIFDARICKSFVSNDSDNASTSYLVADWTLKCENGDSNYEGVRQVFWALFILWPVAVPLGIFGLILYIRPSVQSNSITPLAEACHFFWSDYDKQMMFWEVIDLVRKISLTGLIIFIDTEEGSERILRLLVATGICIFYSVILSRARPYRHKDDLDLAIISNLLLTCCFLVGVIIHQCKEGEDVDGENNMCMKLFGISDSYKATALAVILTAAMLIAFVLFVFVQSVNELKAPTVRLASTNGAPRMDMPGDCKYHFFISHVWVSGQDKVHKIVRTIKLYIQGIQIWLDVDVLENLGDLENSVEESAHFVLFYSKGFFKSVNCRREVIKAIEADKPITVMFEPDDISVDMCREMKDEFDEFWPADLNLDAASNYIFDHKPIMWISNGKQYSLESIKLVAGRLLKGLPYYQHNPDLLDAGVSINGETKSAMMLEPLNILYCSTNQKAHDVALKLVEESKGDVQAREMNLSHTDLQEDDRDAVMLVYLNKKTFKDPACLLCESIKRSMDDKIKIILVHENDTNEGGCTFGEIMNQTPRRLMEKPYNIYSQDIAVSLYSIKEYQDISMYQILTKMGAKPTSRGIHGAIKEKSAKFSKSMNDSVKAAKVQLRKVSSGLGVGLDGFDDDSNAC